MDCENFQLVSKDEYWDDFLGEGLGSYVFLYTGPNPEAVGGYLQMYGWEDSLMAQYFSEEQLKNNDAFFAVLDTIKYAEDSLYVYQAISKTYSSKTRMFKFHFNAN